MLFNDSIDGSVLAMAFSSPTVSAHCLFATGDVAKRREGGLFGSHSLNLVHCCMMRTKGGAGVRTTFWSVQGEDPVSFLKGLG